MRHLALAALCVLAGALAVLPFTSCGEGGSEPTPPAPGASGTPTLERVIGPFTWRTADGFASVRAGEPYKVVLRVTSGYDKPTLPVTAESEDGEKIELEAMRTEPVDGEAGTFYTFRLELPTPGEWIVTAWAGTDAASVQVEVAPAR